MAELFGTYAKITAESVLEKHNLLVNMTYDPSTPISKVYAKAQEYQKYASAFGDRVTANQLMTIVYNILRKTGRFNSSLQKWNEKTPADKTWDNFKVHFRQAATVIKEFASTTTGDVGYANQIANDVTKNLANMLKSNTNEQEQQAATEFMQNVSNAVSYNQHLLPQLINNISTMSEKINTLQQNMQAINLANAASARNTQNPPPVNSPSQQPPNTSFQQMPPPPPPQYPPNQGQFQGYNNTNTNNQFQRMPYCQPTQQYPMQNQNQGFQPSFQQQQQGNRGGRSQGRGNRGGRGNFRQKYYCWSHGVCNHPGVNCRSPSQGHQPYATFQNTMRGSEKGLEKYQQFY